MKYLVYILLCVLVGTTDNPTGVVPWTKVSFSLGSSTNISNNNTFWVTCSINKVQLYDKNRGYHYFFTLKAFNRVRLFVSVSSTQFAVYSSLTPSDGKVWHVHVNEFQSYENADITEIFWQSYSDIMCGAWSGFSHPTEHVQVSIGIGKTFNNDDVYSLTPINANGTFCVSSLQLLNFEKYYFILQATTSEGTVMGTSSGVVIANESFALRNAKVNDANDCFGEYGNIIVGNVTVEPLKNYTIFINNNKYYQDLINIRLEFQNNNLTYIPEIHCFHLSEEVPVTSWHFTTNQTFLYYQLYLIQNNNNITFRSVTEILSIQTIALLHCNTQRIYQQSANVLSVAWTFIPQLIQHVSHFQIAVTEILCLTSAKESCTNEGTVLSTSVAGTENEAKEVKMLLKDGYKYQIVVEPCIVTSCLSGILSNGVTIITGKTESGLIEAQLHITEANNEVYQLTAKWDAFVDKFLTGRNELVFRYDWSLAADELGGALVTPWLPFYSERINTFTVTFIFNLTSGTLSKQKRVLKIF